MWIQGPPGCGKTTFSTWLGYPSNYEGGVVTFQSSDSVPNALHRYSQQAAALFDYPKTFEWGRKAEAVSGLLECFTEYGSRRESTKYQGRQIVIRCHCVVFANILPIDEVSHRSVVLWEAPSLEDSQASTLEMGPRYLPGVGIVDPNNLPITGRDRSRSRSR